MKLRKGTDEEVETKKVKSNEGMAKEGASCARLAGTGIITVGEALLARLTKIVTR